MLTFILTTIIVFMTLCYFYTVKKANWAMKTTLWLIIPFFTLAIILPSISTFRCKTVADISTDDWNRPVINIYYDVDDDIYFYTESNLWNPLKVNYRIPVNHEKMEKYLEIQRECEERLSQINILE